jgi:hypothetical protein
MSNQTLFGIGALFATPVGVANPTPVPIVAVQDITFDAQYEVKELYGNLSFPIDIARGKGKIGITASAAVFDPVAINNLVFGMTQTAGETRAAVAEGGVIPAPAGPYTITAANSATWTEDLGVMNQSTGKMMTRVASGPTTGQYSVASGVYTFAAADTGISVYLNYRYTVAAAAGVGSVTSITNQTMGIAPASTRLTFYTKRSNTGKQLVLTLNQVVCTAFKLAIKNDDFGMPNFTMSAFDDGTGNIGSFSANGTN